MASIATAMEPSIPVSLIVLLSLLSSAAGCLPAIFKNAGDVLSASGFLSMSLTLQIALPSLSFNSSEATIFAPSDAAFALSGQPSLRLLQYHISPLRIDPDELETLSPGVAIPTLLPNRSLIVTDPSFEGQASINGVKIGESPIFDDGSVIVYGIGEFFNSSFQIPRHCAAPAPLLVATAPAPTPPRSDLDAAEPLAPASDLLMSRGYSKMATFLALQLAGFVNRTGLTIFAPTDEAIDGSARNFSDYSLIFRRHAVPTCLQWSDLAGLNAGTLLPTFSEGFSINVASSGDSMELNGVPVIVPDMYQGKFVVVHGLSRVLSLPENQELTGDSFEEFDRNDEPNPSEYGEY